MITQEWSHADYIAVFLRVLEYYSGILFLTTNRVGTIDEAFKSRIHISLHYPPLSKEQTLAIFETNIRKLKEAQQKHQQKPKVDTKPRSEVKIDHESILDYAEWYYENWPDHRWNGRQIRNAFQTANSFAQFDMWNDSVDHDELDDLASDEVGERSSDKVQPVLDWRHFQLVAETVRRFDQYLTEAIGESEAEAASSWGLRADEHDPNQWNDGPVYRPQSRRFERNDHGHNRGDFRQRRGRGRGSSIRNERTRYGESLPMQSSSRSGYRDSRQSMSQRGGRTGTSRSFTPSTTYDPSLRTRQEARVEREPHGRGSVGPRYGPVPGEGADFPGYIDDQMGSDDDYEDQGRY